MKTLVSNNQLFKFKKDNIDMKKVMKATDIFEDIFYNSDTGKILVTYKSSTCKADQEEINSTIELIQYEKKCKVGHIQRFKYKSDDAFLLTEPIHRIVAIGWICQNKQFARLIEGDGNDGVILDLFTASAAIQVWEALSDDSKAKALKITPLPSMINIFWKCLKKAEGK